jgi:hypothetical protein
MAFLGFVEKAFRLVRSRATTVRGNRSHPKLSDPGTRRCIGIKLLDAEAEQIVERRAPQARSFSLAEEPEVAT